jgi:nitroreductase
MDDNYINQLFEERRSTVVFSPREIKDKKLASLFEAARWAPSSYNAQPWRFIVAPRNNKDAFSRVLGLLSPKNQEWAKNAGVLLISLAEVTSEKTEKSNYYAMHDVAQAVSFLTLQATHLGLFVHQMGGFEREKVNGQFNIPENFQPVTAIAIGYPGELKDVSKELMLREMQSRSRNPLQEIVFTTKWEESYF